MIWVYFSSIEYSLLHKATVEPTAVFVQIVLKVPNVVVHPPEPSLQF